MFSEKIENVSNFVGKKTLAPILGYLRTDYVEKFNVKTYGIENLKEIIDKPHIIFSNHNSLVEGGDDSGTRPDHLFIFNQIYKTTGEKLQ
ncbi:MAG: hypothetical protein PHO75_00100 [Candidatus Shapirobacteria bacterium]|nr:hypothetical protein [Candidatus Shapirobacteria bacterium]